LRSELEANVNARVNVDCTGPQGGRDVVLNVTALLPYGREGEWYLPRHTSATIPAVQGASILNTCANGVICVTTCSYISSIAENGESEKLGR
jgi:hypothetical protein